MVTADVDVRRRSPRTALALLLAPIALMSPSAAPAHAVLPDVIALPPGWQPEGIAKGGGTTMFSASIASGDVLAVDVLTGESHLAADAPPGRTAAGLEQDRWGRLWVAGGPTGQAYVYAVAGAPAATFSLGSPPSTFINDMVITRDGAWLIDSFDDACTRSRWAATDLWAHRRRCPSPAATGTRRASTSTGSRPPRGTEPDAWGAKW